jgi:DNA-binding response OmpR family regulator
MDIKNRRDVLVVDDDSDLLQLLVTALSRAGLSCDTADDGAVALQRLAVHHYSVVLLDLMMPRVDACGVIDGIRAWNLPAARRPIILIMTAVPDHDALPSIGEVAHAVLRKPFEIREVVEIVTNCVRVRGADRSEAAQPAAGQSESGSAD